MVNLYDRRLTFEKMPEIGMVGPVPMPPLNRLGMLTDYVVPDERIVACPNQDVVYGIGALALDKSPVVVQVPDFGDRVLGVPACRPAHRQLCQSRQDV